MNLQEYFEQTTGIGILSTADADGKVNAAVYSRPNFIDEETIAFIMAARLTHENLQSNPHAAYLFIEPGDKYVGKRLYLTKIREEEDKELIDKFLKRKEYRDVAKYLVYFHIDKVLPLIGEGE